MLPNTELEAALTAYLTQVGKANVGLVALQLGEILSLHEFATGIQAIYRAPAVAWNAEVAAAYHDATAPAPPPPDVDSDVNLVLTTGIDNIKGSSAGDTIIADNTVNTNLAPTDQINGAGGYDILKILLAAGATATGQPLTLTSIEEVDISGGAVGNGAGYAAAAGTQKLTIEGGPLGTAQTYTVNGQSVALMSKSVSASVSTTINQAIGATATAQAVTLNGFTSDAGFINMLDIGGANITTLNLAASGVDSKIALANAGGALTTLNITGDKGLIVSAAPATVIAINAAGNSGGVNYTLGAAPAAGFTFTGGSGNDTLKLVNDGLASLTSGAQLAGGSGTGDKLGISDTALSGTETTRLNQATGFETLGLNASITLNAGSLTSIKSFALDTAGTTSTLSSLAAGSAVAINASTTSLTLTPAGGVTGVALSVGGSAGGVAVGTLAITGLTSVTLTSSGTAANAITTLTHSDNSVFTVDGGADLTLSLAAGTAAGSKIDGSAATGKLTLTGSAVIASGDVLIGGSGDDTINGGRGADTLTGGAGADTFSFNATSNANSSGGTTVLDHPDVITDFVVGTDKLQFLGVNDIVSNQQSAVQTALTNLAPGASAFDISRAMAMATMTAGGVSFAVYEGDTYVLYETSGASIGWAPDDVFIKLVGVTTLPTFANSVIQ